MPNMPEMTNLKLDNVVHDLPMSVDQAAAYLGVTSRTVDRWISNSGLPVHRLGAGPKAQKRFYRSELDAWIRNRCSDSRPGQDVAS